MRSPCGNVFVMVGRKTSWLTTGLDLIYLPVNCGQSSFVMGSDMLFYCITEVVNVKFVDIFHSSIH